MFSVLLVDDEVVIIKALKSSILWDYYGIDNVYSAEDGLQALDIINHKHIDVVITDISMPHMDGLALIKKVTKTQPGMHCILLTAYSEFGYAREAIRLGVDNYLLKPLNITEVNETLQMTMSKITLSRKNQQDAFCNNILLRWLNGAIEPDAFNERANILGINTFMPNYCVICLKPNGKAEKYTSFETIVLSELKKHYEIYSVMDDSERMTCILAGHSMDQIYMETLIRTICGNLKAENDVLVSIGDTVNSSELVYKSYAAAVELIDIFSRFTQNGFLLSRRLLKESNVMHISNEIYQYYSNPAAYKQRMDMIIHDNSSQATFADAKAAYSTFCMAVASALMKSFPKHHNFDTELSNRTFTYPDPPSPDQQEKCLHDILGRV